MRNIVQLGKTKRLKEAKEEAQAEIEIFRKEQEKEFQNYQRDVSNACGVQNGWMEDGGKFPELAGLSAPWQIFTYLVFFKWRQMIKIELFA